MGQSPAVRDHGRGLGLAGPNRMETELSRFPGAALLAGPKGAILDANPAGEAIAALLRAEAGAALREAVTGALQGRPGQINPLMLTPGAGAAELAFDAAILPWGEGAEVLVLARDITLERSLRAALIESRQRYKDLVEAASDFVWETDAHGCFTFISSVGALGYSAAELVGAAAGVLDDSVMQGGDSPFAARAPLRDMEVWIKDRAGESACLLATALPLFDGEGAWRGARGLCRDITAERRHETRLALDRNRERLLAHILGILREEMEPARVLSAACGAVVPALPAAGAAVYRLDRGGEIIRAAQYGDMPGEDPMQALIARLRDGESQAAIETGGGFLFGCATHFDRAWNGALCLWRAPGEEPWSREDRALLSEIAGQIGLTNRQVAHQEELEELSSTDSLTGLHNRRSFLAELERRFSRRAAWRGGAALFFIDLDNFKAVNDRHGHKRGDRALSEVARILRDCTRGRDLVARLGGDEFAVFVEDIGAEAAESKGREICQAAAVLRDLSGDSGHPLGFSIGAAFCTSDGAESVAEAVERADQAMYGVKRRGKGAVAVSIPAAVEDTP